MSTSDSEKFVENANRLIEAIQEETGNDLLRECAGECGQKILIFGDEKEGAFCLDCKAKSYQEKKNEQQV